jgi:hypothetical protein
MAYSMGAVLLAGGASGRRYSLPHANILIHQPWGGMQGQASDIQIHAKEILRTREVLNGILATHTGQPVERVQQDTERDFFMTPEQAKAYGLIDDIIQSPDKAPVGAGAGAGAGADGKVGDRLDDDLPPQGQGSEGRSTPAQLLVLRQAAGRVGSAAHRRSRRIHMQPVRERSQRDPGRPQSARSGRYLTGMAI